MCRCIAFVRPWLSVLLWIGVLQCATAAPPPVEAFARRSGLERARLSPDGARIVYVTERSGRAEAVVRELESGRERTVLNGGGSERRLRWCDWSGAERVICGTAWNDASRGTPHEETGLVAVDADGAHRRTLMRQSADPVRDRVVDFLAADGGSVLVQYDDEGDGYPAVARLNTRSGALRTVVRGRAPIRNWMSDGRGLVRLGIGYEAGQGSIYVRAAEGDEWNLLTRSSLDDPGAWAPLAFGENPADLYALKLHDGRYALFHVDLNRGGALSLMFAHPEFDVSGPVVLAPATRDLLAVRYVTDRAREHFFDATEQELARRLDVALPDRVNIITNRDSTGARSLVWSSADAAPGTLYVVETATGRLQELGPGFPDLDPRGLGRTVALAYHARDGQLIPAYLTVPRDRPPQNLPAVLLPHGGPETRDEWDFQPLVQLLATRGYAVLQMNFRGSAGFGAAFLAAGHGEWAGTIERDILDGARWLARQAIADPARICIVGSSFGGYAAMLSAVRDADLFACAASYGGIADLVELASGKERFQYADVWRMRLGNDPRALQRDSPAEAVGDETAPLLVAHGRDDVVVPVGQAHRMADALAAANRPHRLAVIESCGHDLVTEGCRAWYYALLADFLGTYLDQPAAP